MSEMTPRLEDIIVADDDTLVTKVGSVYLLHIPTDEPEGEK